MIKIENVEVVGWEHAIRGMRNPKNSWDRMDSIVDTEAIVYDGGFVGPNDMKLMTALAKGGPVHAKYRRMITVYLDIAAPLYWWKEFDTYKVGTVANSCSTMHKIHDKEFELEDFSVEDVEKLDDVNYPICIIDTIYFLNKAREKFNETKDTRYWKQMIQLLPSSYNQKRTVQLNYEVLVGMYEHRKNHKLNEWRVFCDWIKSLPYSELITGEED